ncbi:MAG: hypothetical protein JWO56_927, partial [Acidobacteria bacterium]|nr:hypothetical protein [Acidobacteriota bacterium]
AVVRTNDGIIVADDMGLRISVPEIADAAVAPAGAPLGVPMQLGTTAHAATSWQWSVIRRPAGSSATFSSSIAETPTFTPDIADVYTFRLVATGPAGRRITTVSVTVTQTLDHFRVTVGGANAGSPANVAVQAVDIADNPMPFSGTVHFTSNDPNATLPANYTFPPAENGAHLFNPTFRRAGNDSFTVTEVLTPGTSGPALTGTGQVSVVPGSPAALGISAASPVRAGSLTTVTVTSRDSFGNATTGYLGTVHFVSSDSNATLPENYTFAGGDGGTKTFVATLRKPGVRSIGVYDVANGALNASTNVYVSSPLVNGDIDQSGGNDIYWRNYTNGANAVWLVNGPATTLIVNLPALPNISYRIEGVADFDGDGKPDILWRNPASGANALWLLDGSNLKATVNLPALPNPDYHIAGTADFDGDGDPDIIWRNTFNGANALWIMNGTAFSSIVNLPGLANPDYHLESAADFDGDGKPDILWRNWSTGANALWIMNGTAFVSIVNLDALPNPQYHVGAIGDFDGDGKADIVWRNTNSGANAMWKMNGTVNAGIINFDSLANPSYEMVGPR